MHVRVLLAAVAGLALCGCEGPQQATEPTLYSVKINNTTWNVELAVTPEQQQRGLAERKDLPQGRGMLFINSESQVRSFWMKGCLIPLDIAFIDSNRRVVKIHTMACQPPEIRFKTYSSEVPAQFALEVPAGALRKAGVKVNDVVEFDPSIPLPK